MNDDRVNSSAEAGSTETATAVLGKPHAPRWGLRLAKGAAVTVATLTALVGLMHAPFARSFLMKVGGCPVGNEDAHAIEHARSVAVKINRGDTVAPNREAFGFALGNATLEDIEIWRKKYDISCENKRKDSWVQCTQVSAAATGAGHVTDELNFSFHPDTKTLTSVTAYRFKLPGDEAMRHVAGVRSGLEQRFGVPTKAAGSAESLADHDGATATLNYRFRDLAIDVTGTRIPGRGVAVTESYQSVAD